MFIAYLRANKRFSVEKQRLALQGFTIFREFVDDSTDFTTLLEAIACTKECNGVLVLTSIQYLKASPNFFKHLILSGVPFVCPTDENFSPETVLDYMREAESRITQRSEKASKHHPVVQNQLDQREAARISAERSKLRTNLFYQPLIPRIHRWKEEGWTLQQIANRLNEEGHLMQSGKPFHTTAIIRLLQREIPSES